MKLNIPKPPEPLLTHEGGRAQRIHPEQQLRRSVMACMLWENEFYEDGESIASRIAEAIKAVDPEIVHAIAIEAREQMKLRHVPLLIVREMARLPSHRALVARTLGRVIQRADELSEFLAIYWKDKKQPLSAQVKKGLAAAFLKFNAYQLAKYNREGAISLRDVLFLCHAKPENEAQEALWKQLINDELPVPDTWEVELSASKDKLASWTRLLAENKLGALALLRNLRNMQRAGVNHDLIRGALARMKTSRVLPFRFIAAARMVPVLESDLEPLMLQCTKELPKLTGHTFLLVDVSGSMQARLSAKSDLRRVDAACGLAMLLREVCERVTIFTFSDRLELVPARRGFALRDAIIASQPHNCTYLGAAVTAASKGQGAAADRLIVITDEQSADKVPDPSQARRYMLNVASARNGVGYGAWTHIDGFSEAVVDYLMAVEN